MKNIKKTIKKKRIENICSCESEHGKVCSRKYTKKHKVHIDESGRKYFYDDDGNKYFLDEVCEVIHHEDF